MIMMPSPSVHTRAPGLLVPGFKTNWQNVGQKHGKVRFRLALIAADGYLIHRHFIDDPEDAEWLYRVVLGLVPTVEAPSWLPSPQDYPGSRFELLTYNFLTTTGTGTWNKPGDWNNASNTIHCIGGGGGGWTGAGSMNGGGGGGGGAYAGSTNLSPGSSVTYSIGVGGLTGSSVAAADTIWGATVIGSAIVGAVAGVNASTGTGGAGGSSASCVGTTKYSGGAGGNGMSVSDRLGGAGGGSAGPNGAGGSGANGTNSYGAGGGGANGGSNGSAGSGTTGGNGRGGTGGGTNGGSAISTVGTNGGGGGGGGSSASGFNYIAGRAGGIDAVWDSTHGPEGGSGGGGWDGFNGGGLAGGTPVYYGSGSGGSCGDGGWGTTPAPRGGQGIITVSYQPISVAFFRPAFP